jgi:hypothetical protein
MKGEEEDEEKEKIEMIQEQITYKKIKDKDQNLDEINIEESRDDDFDF